MTLGTQINLSILQDHIITYPFDDRNVRFFYDAGCIWVIARDICDIIGYSNATDFFAEVDPRLKQKIKGKNPQGTNPLIAVEITQAIQKLFKSKKHNSENLAKFILYTGKILLMKQEIKKFHKYTGLSEKLLERVCEMSQSIGANVLEKAIDVAISCIEEVCITARKERAEDV